MASFASVPHEAIGTLMPMPRKLRNASLKIAPGTRNAVETMIGPIELGSMCEKRILRFDAPASRAAITYSDDLSVRT